MFKSGDRYIHFTRFGGINIGEVEFYNQTEVIDTANKITYFYPYIKTKSGIVLYLDGSDGKIYKINKVMTEKDIEMWIKIESIDPKNAIRARNGMLTSQEIDLVTNIVNKVKE